MSKRQAGVQIEINDKMIEAGTRVLAESGHLDHVASLSPSLKLLVAEILRQALSQRPLEQAP